MNEKKIEPTDAMVRDLEFRKKLVAMGPIGALRYVLNHPDARGLFAAEDDRPWEPLNEGTLLCRGDEVREEWYGVTRTGVVGRVDGNGDPWTAEGGYIGPILGGTWYVRRPVQELPEEDGAVIVPADGCQFIETRTGKKSRRLTWDAECLVWYDARGTHLHGDITPGTWKVDNR